jgi:hypothetical protein
MGRRDELLDMQHLLSDRIASSEATVIARPRSLVERSGAQRDFAFSLPLGCSSASAKPTDAFR